MKKRSIILSVLAFALFISFAVGMMLQSSAAESAVVEEDWLKDPQRTLVKCSGNGCDHTSCDYVYSFAVVGDTQNLNYIDVTESKNYMNGLYRWILSNKNEKNIQYVLGLGDITQSYYRTYKNELWAKEWENAGAAISLLDGTEIDGELVKVPYSLVRGNHDISGNLSLVDGKPIYDGGFNGTFGYGTSYYSTIAELSQKSDDNSQPMAGFRNPDKIEDTYRKIEIGGHKYIIFTLDWHPTKAGDASLAEGEKDALSWVDGILTANSDYKAIITLHSFLYYDGSLTDITEDRFPIENLGGDRENWEEVSRVGGNATPDELWAVLKTHANVEMILCGHIDNDDIIAKQLKGDNGNTVTCMLIDGQTIDSQKEPVGLVAMFYVSADGSVMNVEYISTVRDNENRNAYLKEKNQFEVDLDVEKWVEYAGAYIPKEKYEDESAIFHVVLDDDSDNVTQNIHFGSFSTWEETLAAIHTFNTYNTLDAGVHKTWSIVMTRDYTFTKTGLEHNKAGGNPGKTVLDLGGNKLTCATSTNFLPYYNATASFRASFTVMNGDIEIQGSSRFIRAQHGHVNATNGYSDLNFENLNITYASNAKQPLISFSAGSSGGPSNLCFNITNCTIDASKNAAITIFNLKDDKNNNNTHLVIKGGSIKGSTTANTTVFAQNFPGDTISFIPDDNGKYTTFAYNDNVQLEGVFGSAEENKYLEFSVPTENGGKYESTLVSSGAVMTKYGPIPSDKASADAFPFALFKDGKMLVASSDWKKLIDNELNDEERQSGCTLLVRRDYETSESSGGPSAFYRIKDIVIDLDDHALISNDKTNKKHLFQAIGSNNTYISKITVKNGTIKGTSAGYAPIIFNDSTKSTSVESFDFIFDNVKCDVSEGVGIVSCNSTGTVGCGAANTVTLKNCTILRDSNDKAVNIFHVNNKTQDIIEVDIKIEGGTLDVNSMSNINFAVLGDADSFMIEGDFEVNLPYNYTVPDTKYTFTDSTYCLVEKSNDGSTVRSYEFYNLGTPYGILDVKHVSVDEYPFVVFKNNEVIHTFKDWYTFIQTDINDNSELRSGCTVLLRKNYSSSDASGKAYALYRVSSITFDLGGNTLYSGTNHLFQSIGGGKHGFVKTEITIKNGTLKAEEGGYAPITFNDDAQSKDKEIFNYTLENVTVDVSNGKGLIQCYGNSGATSGIANTVTLKNCTIYRDSNNAKVTLFSLKHSNPVAEVDVIINGGKLDVSSMSNITFATYDPVIEGETESRDSLSFGDSSFVITLPKSEAAPSQNNIWKMTNGAECVFIKKSETDANANYCLYPKVMIGYKVKTSVTLWSNFVYNVYIPKANVASFNVNGITKANEEIEIDGVLYYLVKVELPAPESLSDIAVCVTLNSGSTTVDANWTLNVLNYTKSVIGGSYDDTTKNLMRDMLVYASAAHTYFENTENVADKLTEIDTLLGDYNAELPEGEAKAPADKTYFTSATVNLGEVPSFRFYLAEGYTADDFSFQVGQRNVTATTGEDKYGNYLEVVMYAYMMLDDVTYTVTDKLTKESVTESYNLYSYYENADKANKNLIALVEGLMKYSVSAAAYRASVVEN